MVSTNFIKTKTKNLPRAYQGVKPAGVGGCLEKITCYLCTMEYEAFYVGLYHEIDLVDVVHGDLEAHQVKILEPIVVVYII